MNLTARIVDEVEALPGLSATDIARHLRVRRRVASVSGILARLTKAGRLKRTHVRGAWRYRDGRRS